MNRAHRIAICLLSLAGLMRVHAQDVELRYAELDTSSWWWANSESHLGLAIVASSPVQTFIRISIPGQIVDLVSTDDSTFEGSLVQYTWEYKEVKKDWGKDHDPSRYVHVKDSIDAQLATRLGRFLLRSGLDTLAHDSLIPGWSNGWTDCWSFEYQWNKQGRLIARDYYCSSNQNDTIPEKRVIMSSYERIKADLDLQARYQAFTALLPGGTYSHDGFIMLLKSKAPRKRSKKS